MLLDLGVDVIEAAEKPFDWNAQEPAISTPVFMTLLALATLVTEDLTCISAGIFTSRELGTSTSLP